MPDRVQVNHVDVWLVRPDRRDVQSRLADYRTLLSADEAARATRFVSEDAAVRFLVGRALARTMLSSYAEVAPRAWPIGVDARGRPGLTHRPDAAPDLRFNLAHTAGLVACAVAVAREVGIDVEHVGRRVAPAVVDRVFAPHEALAVRVRPADEQAVAFLEYWTLKEAYLKARGLGIVVPLRHVAFVRGPGRAPALTLPDDFRDDPASWQFVEFQPTAEHLMAVAVRRTGADLPVRVREVVPQVDP